MRFALRFFVALSVTLVAGLLAAPPALAQSADLQMVKLDSPDPVFPGGNITYEILLTNAGPDTAAFASLADTLPAGTTFVALFAPAGWTCTTPAVGAGGTVSCSIDALAVGVADFFITVQVDSGVTPGTVITNTASASAETPDPDQVGPSASADTTVAAPPPFAEVSVTKTDAPDPVALGGNLVYTITVTSSGTTAATAVNLNDALPLETTFVSLASPGGWSCSTPAVGAGGTVTCSIATLAPGSAVFTLTVQLGSGATPGSPIVNTATVSATDDLDESNNVATSSTAVEAAVSVSGTKTVTGGTTPGSTATYTIVLTNTGPEAQPDNPGDELTDVLPPTLTLVSAAATSGTATATIATNTVTWNGPLAAGGSVTVTIQATIGSGVAAGTTISNQGTIAYDSDANGTNDASAVTDDPATAAAGDPTSFVVTAQPSVLEIPALDGFGLGTLAALLALSAARRLRRRRS